MLTWCCCGLRRDPTIGDVAARHRKFLQSPSLMYRCHKSVPFSFQTAGKTCCCKAGNVLRYTYNQGGRHLPDITLTFVWPVKIADWVERHCALRMCKSTPVVPLPWLPWLHGREGRVRRIVTMATEVEWIVEETVQVMNTNSKNNGKQKTLNGCTCLKDCIFNCWR